MYPSAHVVIAGDLNARTKDLIDYIRNYNIFYVFVGDVNYTADSFDMPRNNKDCFRLNNFGKSFTDFCRSHDMHIMNGRLYDHNEGNYTCLSNDGRSVVYYFITNIYMFKYVSYFTIKDGDDFDHYPVICNLSFLKISENEISLNDQYICQTTLNFRKLHWRKNYSGRVCNSFSREPISNENCILDIMNSNMMEQ